MSHIYKRNPLEHQREALNKSFDKKYFLYLMGMGTGKTKVAIDNAVFLFNQGEIDTVFIVVPNSITHNWLKEIDVDSSAKGFKYLFRRDTFDYHLKDHINWYVMNVEALSHASGVKVAKKLISSCCVDILSSLLVCIFGGKSKHSSFIFLYEKGFTLLNNSAKF